MPTACKRRTESRKRPHEMANFLRALGLGAEALMPPAVGGPLRCDRWLGACPAPPEPWVLGSRQGSEDQLPRPAQESAPWFSCEQPRAPRPACWWDASRPHSFQTCPRRSTPPSWTSPSGGRFGCALPMVTSALCASSESLTFRELYPRRVRGMGCIQTPTYRDHTENSNLSFV